MAAPFTCFSLMCWAAETTGTAPPDSSNWADAGRDLWSGWRQRLQAVVDGVRRPGAPDGEESWPMEKWPAFCRRNARHAVSLFRLFPPMKPAARLTARQGLKISADLQTSLPPSVCAAAVGGGADLVETGKLSDF